MYIFISKICSYFIDKMQLIFYENVILLNLMKK